MLTPRQKTPDLILPTVNGETFELSNETSERGTVVCFYRGLHWSNMLLEFVPYLWMFMTISIPIAEFTK